MIDKIIESLESMAEDMRAMGDNEKASGVESALWLIEEMADRKDESSSEKPNNCTNCECTDDCTECKEAEHGCKDEATISKTENVEEESFAYEEIISNARLAGYQDGVKACNEEWLVRLGYK